MPADDPLVTHVITTGEPSIADLTDMRARR
jgi:hypothetical protein